MRELDDTVATEREEPERHAPAPSSSPETTDLYERQFEGTEDASEHVGGSLSDDLAALFDDGRTYAQAEMAFQKSRAGFAANRAKYALAYGAAAFGALHLALIAVAVGLVIALVPIVGPWIATAIVGAALVVIGLMFLRALKAKVNDIRTAFSETGE